MGTAPLRVPLDMEGQENDGGSSVFSGLSDGIPTVQKTIGEASTSGKSETSSCQITKTENCKHKKTLGLFAANFFDEKISVSKKLITKFCSSSGSIKLLLLKLMEPYSSKFHSTSSLKTLISSLNSHPLDQQMKTLEHGHRVRLATHSNFREFVLTAGLEFYPLGGDPKVLAWYMVKNKGILPSGPSEIQIQRNELKDIILSLLPACMDPDPHSKMPFEADAIIANPPACGHIHVAEALKIPIHIFFTMPWTPTGEFPHPLSRVKQPAGYKLSYQIIDALIWLATRDMINEFRKKKLKLRPVTYLCGSNSPPPDVPVGYTWSPHLVPKPKDWGPKIDVVGFCFLDLASSYEPPDSLLKWLEEGDKPIYIGFGSLPVQEPQRMTDIIIKALEATGQRGIISKGWGGLGNLSEPKESVYLLDNCPHDWLFARCSAVVHHGGAGTTAAGLRAACPTTIIPFFGDQTFWGEQVYARGVGPAPIPVDGFSLEKLIDAIRFMLDPKVKERAMDLAKAMENEDGVGRAVNAFYKHFPRRNSSSECELVPAPSSFLSIRRCFGCS
ncbi:sterol 3-beta-glucosyltransferase UGT80A2-like isoform X3 [Rhodamnia argentea]|uniref:Sterol 3-beta-glucosyltransferase UGT80A2-like isoform X3 n=2 Tax=Rhodamnia argentea TaxID=178133 RepID=A0ABM3HG64_9MYRT|nr:sterol 3-beta-glucosyltransferase UGT80A2-like isoform X3 [Rhodamnia argentea]